MAQTEISGSNRESLLNIFPNPCIGDTYLYTDDPEAAWIIIYDINGIEMASWPIEAGRTLHIHLSLDEGTYQLSLKDYYLNTLGVTKPLYVSASF